jgi:hypothetical protein
VARPPGHRHICLISASDLKRQRGWTETLVCDLLGAPDALGPNPHGFRPPMRFFREERVSTRRPGPGSPAASSSSTRSGRGGALQPTRVLQAGDVAGLEWLEDPRPHRAVPRAAATAPPAAAPAAAPPAAAAQPGLRFEVLRLF